jgi:DNA-binding NarL/FixJ family response regulator
MSKPDTSAPVRPARIVIVDDHPLVREGLTALLAGQDDLEVCGEADDVDRALAVIKAQHPDLVVVDISLKGGSGLDLIKQLNARDSEARVLVSSMYDEELYAERALRAGAVGYINKQEMPQKVLEAIRQVLTGKMFLSPTLTERLLHRAVSKPGGEAANPVADLSDRELEIFQMVGQGMTTRQVANSLHLSVKTVETHRENIKAKLRLANSAELTRQAVLWVLGTGRNPGDTA